MSAYAVCCIFVVAVQIISACPAFAQGPASMPETQFSNPQSINVDTSLAILAPTKAATYPSPIAVSGMTGNTTRVAVTLLGVSHLRLTDLDMLLVSPTGQKFVFLSDSSALSTMAADMVLSFSDDAPGTISPFTQLFSGSYKPTSGDGLADAFPIPAPAGPYVQPPSGTFASAFNGASPNGDWLLYVADDQLGTGGSLNSGWQLTITTDGPPTTFSNSANLAILDVHFRSAPYGTAINVAGLTGAISKVTVSLTGVSHGRPSDIDVLLVTPNGQGLVLMSDAGGSTAASGINLTFDDSAPGGIVGSLTSGTFQPTDNPGTADLFPAPAPLAPYFASYSPLSSLNGFSPNGVWQLYVVDSAANQTGSISGGWSIDITTAPLAPPTNGGCAGPSFTSTSFQTGVGPTNMAIADFNNDTKLDLVVTNQVAQTVSLLLGNGDGTFGAQTLIAVFGGANPYSVVAGKFNADNNFDLAVISANAVSISLGNGNGTFSSNGSIQLGPSPISIAIGDFNNDTKQDLAIANFGGFFIGSVSILLGNGNGGFVTGNTLRTGTQPSFVLVARLNADANDDLVVTTFGNDRVSTFLGSGTGTFTVQQNLFAGSGPVGVEVVDLGTDGFADLAVVNYNGETVRVFAGNANGLFNTNGSDTPAGGGFPTSITAADYVGNGRKELATALSGSNQVKVTTANLAVGQNPNAVRTADLNSDGKPDLVSVNSGSNDVTVLINSCLASSGNIFDFDADGKTDYSVYRRTQGVWYTNIVNGTKVFGRPTDLIVPADYDGDRRTDHAIYRPDSGLWFVVGQNNKPLYFYQFGTAADIPAPADYDGDGKADLAVWRPSDGNWYIRRSTDASFAIINFGLAGDKPVPADYDGDGLDDIAIFRPSSGIWYIMHSSNGQITGMQFGITEDKTVAADYDADGKADIAVWRPSTGVWYILKSSNGSVESAVWGISTDLPVPGDYDGDGRIDFAVFRPSDTVWYVKKSSDGLASFVPWGVATDTPVPNAFVR